jgi:UDP-perosamine 4-acetyltransferase
MSGARLSVGHRLVLLGAGGHASVLLALVHATGYEVAGVCDPVLAAEGVPEWHSLPVLGGDEALGKLDPQFYSLVNGIGQLPGKDMRRRLFEHWHGKGFTFPTLVHPFSWVAEGVAMGAGVQVMAGAVIQPGCAIGDNSTINTGARLDHDCRVGAHVHIAPAATLCGQVTVADHAFIGAGATLVQGLEVGSGATIGAGVTCVRSVAPGEVLIGSPNRRLTKP